MTTFSLPLALLVLLQGGGAGDPSASSSEPPRQGPSPETVRQLFEGFDSRSGDTPARVPGTMPARAPDQLFSRARNALGLPEDKIPSDLIEYAQRRLSERGYEPGPIDGILGPKTREAVRRYQSDLGLIATGKFDILTFNLLYEEPSYQLGPLLSREKAVSILRQCFGWSDDESADLPITDLPITHHPIITPLMDSDGVQRCKVGSFEIELPIHNYCLDTIFQAEVSVVILQHGEPVALSERAVLGIAPRGTVQVPLSVDDFVAECLPEDDNLLPDSEAIITIGRVNLDALFREGKSREALRQ